MKAKLNNSAAYLFAFAVLVLAGVLLWGQPAEAQRSGIYHLVAHSNQTSNVGIFRVNESTGQVSFCFVEGTTSATTVRCTPEVQ